MKALIPFVLIATILTVSCATAPAKTPAVSPASTTVPQTAAEPTPVPPPAPTPTVKAAAVKAPAWTTKSTYTEGSNLVFVLAGAEKADVASLALQSMTTYLNLPLNATTPQPASAAVQAFLKKMSATIPTNSFINNGHGWWRLVVNKAEWDNSQAHLAALFQVVPADPLAEQEKAADEAFQQGRYFEAVNQYVGVASAAVAEGSTPQKDRFQSVLAKAQAILSQFTLASPTPAQETQAGRPFDSAFTANLTYGTGAQVRPVGGALLRFSYKTKVNGHLVMTGQTLKTDAQGNASLALPTPDFGVKDNVVVMIDVNPWLEALAKVPQPLRDPVGKFEPLSANRKILVPYTVDSASKQVPLIVALADFDDRGGIERRQESTSALIAALKDAGFQASGLSINLSLLKSPKENVVLTAWRFQGKTTGRAVYGTVNLVSAGAADSQFTAEVTGTVKVVDLATSQPVYQYKNSKIVNAPDKASAITQGFRQWAVDAAAAMADELP